MTDSAETFPSSECIHQPLALCIGAGCPMFKMCLLAPHEKESSENGWRPKGWEDAHTVLIRETNSRSMDSVAMYELGASNMLKALRHESPSAVLSDKYRITM